MIYDVRDFGATGNGVTDDTAAIQAAVNAAHAAGGGQVYIPAGTYIVTGHSDASQGSIMLYDNITVYGDGMGQTTVKLQDGWNGDITGIFRTQAGVENHDIGMHDITIDGNRANTSGKIDGWFNGVSPGEPGTDRNITLDHVEIMNCAAYGFDPHEETTNLVITNCVAHGNGLDGFTLDYQIDAHIINNIAYDNDRHGFNIVTSSHDVELIDNIAYGNGGNGIIVQRGSDDIPVPHDILISGGSLHDNLNDGIQINKADRVTIDGVEIYLNGERGVRIMGSLDSIVENSFIHDNSHEKNLAFEEIRLENYDDTSGVSGLLYLTTGTIIANNTITGSGAIRANYSIRENTGVDYTTISNNTIYGTGSDRPSLKGEHSVFTQPPLDLAPTTDPNAPHILYAPLLGQSNAELFKLSALDGGTGLSHVESGLQQRMNFARVVSMTNMAVGGSTVDGDRHVNQDPALVWWYPDQNKPGPALLNAVDQMQHQLAELRTQGIVTPIVIWGQGEAEANQLGTSKSDAGRRLAEQEYINSTRLVFNYIQDHIGHDVQFYLMETGRFNQTGATNFGYPQSTIDKINLGLTYVHDAQEKMALAWSDVHLGVNYIDLPMNADVDPSVPNYSPDWASDAWHLSLDSKETAADRLANFIALDRGFTHILDNPGPYPRADLADFTLYGGPGVTVTGNANNNIIVGTLNADTLSGAGGADVIIGGGGTDILTGGTGSDIFYFHPFVLTQIHAVEVGTTASIVSTITDFQTGAGGDVIDVSALLRAAGYTGTNPVADGRIIITQQAADTVISFDQDGAGTAYSAVAIARLAGVNAGQFDIANNLFTQFPSGNLLVLNAHQPPWARDDGFASLIGQTVHGNVLTDNGLGPDFSPDGDALSTVSRTVTTAQGGIAVLNASGSFDYTPAVGFYGTDSFTYGLRDSEGGQDTGTVTIAVNLPAGAIVGTAGNDNRTGGSAADTMLGLDGDDTLSGGSNNDVLYGGAGNDTLNGNGGNDILYGMGGNNILNGNDNNDILYAGSGNDALNGGNGNDTLIAASGVAVMSGNSGVDTFILTKAGSGIDTITDFVAANGEKIDIGQLLLGYNAQASTATDYVHATAQGSDIMISVDADGTLNGANFSNILLLRNITNFDVTAMAAGGNLILTSGQTAGNHAPVAANDDFTGWQNLQVHGSVLADNGHGLDSDPDGDSLTVAALAGVATAHGSVDINADGTFLYTPQSGYFGNDSFNYTLLDGHGGSAAGTVVISIAGPLTGTAGDDIITGGSRDDVIQGLGGNDTLGGGGGNDTIYGDAGNDNLNGNAGNDTLYAVSGNDILHGNDDNDTLYAGSGADQLYGDNGNDLLIAATGGATMTGGGGADTFKFTDVSGNVCTIADFRPSVSDKIDIADIIEGYDPATQSISDFVHATFQGAHTMLSVDVDGTANGINFTDLTLVQNTHIDIAALIASGNLVV